MKHSVFIHGRSEDYYRIFCELLAIKFELTDCCRSTTSCKPTRAVSRLGDTDSQIIERRSRINIWHMDPCTRRRIHIRCCIGSRNPVIRTTIIAISIDNFARTTIVITITDIVQDLELCQRQWCRERDINIYAIFGTVNMRRRPRGGPLRVPIIICTSIPQILHFTF